MEDPRDEAAVRTALMMGAEFVQIEDYRLPHSLWMIKGIEYRYMTKPSIAWLFLAMHGIGIDKHGVPRLLKDIQHDVAQEKSHHERE